jgi:hypothetical protein
LRDIGAAVLAGAGGDVAFGRRIWMQRAMRARGRLALPAGIRRGRTEDFCPLLGGVLELSGVFFVRLSLASSSDTRFVRRSIIFACDKIGRISASRSSESSPELSMRSLNQRTIPVSMKTNLKPS